MSERPEVNQFYVHYKGGIYVVLTLAQHTERDEELVIYRHLSGAVYARPVEDWMSPVTEVQPMNADGVIATKHLPGVKRFTKIPPCFKLDLHGVATK